jgi:hypothetical protein
MTGALQVHGKCPKCGHEFDTVAMKNRVTWRGPCPVEGCGQTVVARRKKAGEHHQVHEEKEPATAPESKPDSRRRVVKVSGYTRAVRAADSEPAGVRPDPQPATRPAPATSPSTGGEPTGEPGRQPERRPDPVRADGPEHGRHRAPYDFVGW